MKIIILLTASLALISTSKAVSCDQKREWGSNCKSCKERVFCLQMLEEWEEIPLDTCGDGFICQGAGECVASNDTCYNNAKNNIFECKMEGVFPDPDGCDHYYVCTMYNGETGLTLTPIRVKCPEEKLYSARTQSCTLYKSNSSCTEAYCRNPGEAISWPDNDNLYYLCVLNDKMELYPMMLRCAPNEKFEGGKCVKRCAGTTVSSTVSNKSSDVPAISTEPVTTKTSSTSTPTPAPTPTPITKPAVILPCTKQGIKRHPTDCSKYYYCDRNLTPSVYNCAVGSYFDPSFGLCVKGSC
ncbi:unnamed protein product [Hermetia illucens]|uniref:Chitin-binding type-2 domain-containing protein n=1 Tax=Hermetia illucens TaxID=343691 RepID=A0A7R8YT51_HERIL|nr:uncharacterized protein LOC119648392 [Hermetia illucens]CAD7083295.1 unnamed protein product [Hermetia illucens]